MSISLETNPLRVGLARERVADPCVFVIFGGTGDLAHRKLIPALYHLYLGGMLPRACAIVSYASSDMSDEQYRDWVRGALSEASPKVPTEGRAWEAFREKLHYVRRAGDTLPSLQGLRKRLDKINSLIGAGGNYLFYLAIPPASFSESAEGLQEAGLSSDDTGWRRLVIEKPFGTDLASARALNSHLLRLFAEDQIYRIDHYLGKETVQNILVYRFANQVSEPLLNADHVDHIQITVAETLGVEKRGAFYDSTGALRDIIQNHALQVMALVMMEPPSSLNAEAVRDEKTKLLESVRCITPDDAGEMAVRGQYGSGRILGEKVAAYLEEPDVAANSITETYVALKLLVDNPRWSSVPVYVRTGKRMAKRVTEVGIVLKDPTPALFAQDSGGSVHPNVMALNIQPDEGIAVSFEAKVPGVTDRLQPVRMDFRYGSAFGTTAPDAYERLILDAMLGDQSLFSRSDTLAASWEICGPILEGWRHSELPVHTYAPGGWGPKAADDMIARDGRRWRRL